MTNTPALAAVRELLRQRGRSAGLSPEQLRAASDEPVVAYSIAYPMGVVTVLVGFAVTRRLWKPAMEPLPEGSGDPRARLRGDEPRRFGGGVEGPAVMTGMRDGSGLW